MDILYIFIHILTIPRFLLIIILYQDRTKVSRDMRLLRALTPLESFFAPHWVIFRIERRV